MIACSTWPKPRFDEAEPTHLTFRIPRETPK